jgi:hypothetical protein
MSQAHKIIIAAFLGGIVGGVLFDASCRPSPAHASYYSDAVERIVKAVERSADANERTARAAEHTERMIDFANHIHFGDSVK